MGIETMRWRLPGALSWVVLVLAAFLAVTLVAWRGDLGGLGWRTVEMEETTEKLSDDVITAPMRVFGDMLGWAGRQALKRPGEIQGKRGDMVVPDMSEKIKLFRVGGRGTAGARSEGFKEQGLRLGFHVPTLFRHPTMRAGDHLSARNDLFLPTVPHNPLWNYDASPNNENVGASMRFDAAPCTTPGQKGCKVKANFHLEVFCPPYIAPNHGWVEYKGVRHSDATAHTPAAREFFDIKGNKLPIAQVSGHSHGSSLRSHEAMT